MGNKAELYKENKQVVQIIQEGNFDNIKSKYILKQIFDNLTKNKTLRIVHNNIKLINRLGIDINDFIENSESCTSIEIEIIPKKKQYGKFINIINKEDEKYFHVYFNDNKTEIKKYNILKNDKVFKINIKIDYQIKSFYKLFDDCKCIEYITFNKFYRNDIKDMSYMFNNCLSLKQLNLFNFNTNKVTNMTHMFYGCVSLISLDLSNFNTSNVIDMSYMFCYCNSLKKLKMNFDTKNVKNMSHMFEYCKSIDYLEIYNFNTNNVIDMSYMFYGCSLLKELEISKFNFSGVENINSMFSKCSDELKIKIHALYPDIGLEAFDEDDELFIDYDFPSIYYS